MPDAKPTLADDLRAQVRAHGAVFNPEVLAATRAIFRPHIDPTPAAAETADIAYGAHPRQKLDVYAPAGRSRGVFVFVPGGGFVGGDKNGDGTYYVNVGRWLARQGFAAVLPNYRLAPDHGWPAGARDVAAVLGWIRGEGGRAVLPSGVPLFVLGQSAGASHVASWLFDDEARGESTHHGVSAVMLMSGFYRLAAPLPAGPQAYFGTDAAAYPARAPLAHVKMPPMPVWLSLAALDPVWLAPHTYALAEALTVACGQSPHFDFLEGHNHVSTVQSLGSPLDDAGARILHFAAHAVAG